MKNIFFRKEDFGGILFDSKSMIFLNRVYSEILIAKSKKMSNDEIKTYICSIFNVEDASLIDYDISIIDDAIKNIGTSDNSQYILKEKSREFIPTISCPIDLHWEITSKCNLKCHHCYNNSNSHGINPCYENIKGVINELKKYRMRSIVISGGEPMIRDDIFKILEDVRPLTMELILSTNGVLLNKEKIDKIYEHIDTVNISFDAASKKDMELFRGVDGIFEKVLSTVRLLRKTDMNIVAQTVISRLNFNKLKELAELLLNEGVKNWSVRLPVRVGQYNNHTDTFLSIDEAIKQEENFKNLYSDYSHLFDSINIGNSFVWSYKEDYIPFDNKDRIVNCAAGVIMAALRADGRLIPCPLFGDSDYSSEPVWGGHFIEQWKSSPCLEKMRNLHLHDIYPCNKCGHLKICSLGCRAKAFLSGKISNPDPDCNYSNLSKQKMVNES